MTTDEKAYLEAEHRLWEHYDLAPAERRVRLPGAEVRVRVLEFGDADGDAVLFVHGSPTSGATFAPLVAEMTGWRCVVLDRPNSGLSDPRPITSDGAEAYLRSLLPDVLDALGLPAAHVVASSMGSGFAVHAALAAPERIRSTVHVGGPWLAEGGHLPAVDRMLLLPGMTGLISRMRPNRKQQDQAMRNLGHGPSMDDGRIPEAYDAWYDALVQHTDTYRRDLGSLAAFRGFMRYRSDLEYGADEVRDLTTPTAFVWGRSDAYGDEQEARRVAAMFPNATLEVLDGGHLPWLDQPGAVATAITTFLESVTSAA